MQTLNNTHETYITIANPNDSKMIYLKNKKFTKDEDELLKK